MAFTPVLGGITVTWDNPEELELKLEFTYEQSGEEKTQVVESAMIEDEFTVPGMENGQQVLRVTVADQFDFSFSEDFTRSEEHTSELQSLMRISYAVFCL